MTVEETMALVEAQVADELRKRRKPTEDVERDRKQYEQWLARIEKGCCG